MDEKEKMEVYHAWRNSESYQIPMTEEGMKLADARYHGFRKGWAYAKFFGERGHVDMKEYSERYDDES